MLVRFSAVFLLLQHATGVRLGASNDQMGPEVPAYLRGLLPGNGCDESYKPTVTVAEQLMIPAQEFMRYRPDGTVAWNGFCQGGDMRCPDAVANRDYYQYARALGPAWINKVRHIDGDYCYHNGFLKPELAKLTHNFTAIRDKAAELCRTTYNDPKYSQEYITVDGKIPKGPFKDFQDNTIAKFRARMRDGSSPQNLLLLELPDPTPGEGMDEEYALHTAAHNCALGDLACDITYCNYGFCEKPGGYGVMEECPGFNQFSGQPRAWP